MDALRNQPAEVTSVGSVGIRRGGTANMRLSGLSEVERAQNTGPSATMAARHWGEQRAPRERVLMRASWSAAEQLT